MLDTSANTAHRLTGSVATHDKGEQCLEIEPVKSFRGKPQQLKPQISPTTLA